MRIGIMQGRLLPPAGSYQCFPAEGWEREFAAAAQAGLQCIEWIYDVGGAQANPLGSEEGAGAHARPVRGPRHGGAHLVCADYFMEERPLLRCSEAELEFRLATLRWLLQACARVGAGRVVLPFVDNSRMETAAERRQVAQALRRILPDAAVAGVELHLETALAPPDFQTFLDALPAPSRPRDLRFRQQRFARVSGCRGVEPLRPADRQRPHRGPRPRRRLRPPGNRRRGFPGALRRIRKSGYDGDLILQAARQAPGGELTLARANRGFVERCLAA